MKFKNFYKLVDPFQTVYISIYCGEKEDEEAHFEGFISEAPIGFGEYTIYTNKFDEAISTSAEINKHGIPTVTMYINLQVR